MPRRVRFYQANTQPSGKGDRNIGPGAQVAPNRRDPQMLEGPGSMWSSLMGSTQRTGLNDFMSFWPFLRPGGIVVCDDLHDPSICGGTHERVDVRGGRSGLRKTKSGG